MNDLFSDSSFKKYTDLKHQVQLDDDELDLEGGEGSSANLHAFFSEVEGVKNDLSEIEGFHRHLQSSHEESKVAQSTEALKAARLQMERDVERVLKMARLVKGKLEALERANAENRKLPRCGPGSSADRARKSVVFGLGKKLNDIMNDFQSLRMGITNEYKETVQRRYFTVTGHHADDDTIESLISSGQSETFLQKAIQEQGKGQIIDAISEIQERHDAVKELEKSLMDLHQVFLDMAALVDEQGQQLNDIQTNVLQASSFVRKGQEALVDAKQIQRSSRKCQCIAILAGLILVLVIVIPVLVSINRSSN